MADIDVTSLVLDSLKEILAEMNDGDQPDLDKLDESTRLIGRKAVLNSLGLVSTIVNIEQKLEEDYDVTVTIADERAMSQERSPFRTVQTLSEYVSLLIDEQRE